jgi:RNA polymerase sigma-70 factor (ECF subfamily)
MANIKKEFSKIYDKYIDKIYRFVFIKVSSQEIAEDLTSEAFLRCWESYKNNYREIDNVQAFLYQIARNLVVDHYREKGRTQVVPADCVPIADPRANLEEDTAISSDMGMVKSALSNLNEDYQEMIIWHYLDDLSVPEIAKVSGKSEGAIRVTLHRALKALKSQLGDGHQES